MAKKTKKRNFLIPAAAGAILILAAVYFTSTGAINFPSLGGPQMEDAKYQKVIVLGIDGMDPGITDQLMAEGKLPNFKRLSESGSYISLDSSYPPHSPVAWTSIATGSNPAKHNIFDFIRRSEGSYLPKLSLAEESYSHFGTEYSSYVKTDPFWRITTNSKIPTTVIRWPVSFPPERIEGDLLSGLGVPDIRGFLSGYTVLTEKELTEKDRSSKKVYAVSRNGNVIEASLFGPEKRTKEGTARIEVPLKITLSGSSAEILADGKTYTVNEGEWSGWIRVKFKAGTFKNIYGIFRVYLTDTEPFELYVTTIQIDPRNPWTPISAPEKYSANLAEEIGDYYTLGMPEETDGLVDEKLDDQAFLEHINQIETERDKMFWKEFEEFNKRDVGVFAFVYDSSDRVQHVFWDDKLLTEAKTETIELNPAVVNHFVKKDELIGRVLDQTDDDTLIIIVSDHGFTSFERGVSINTWLVENGYMTLKQDIPEGEDGALFKYVDWSKTKAYSLGFNSLYINVKGREPQGIVNAQDREKVAAEIATALEGLTDSNGKKPVNKAYKREEIYNGPLMDNSPDIIIGFSPGYRMAWETAIGGFTKDVIYDNTKKWDGDHLVDPKFVPGVLFTNAKISKTSASQLDVAPTVLDAVGITVPASMDGKSLLQ
jgi:predicted AlkP superfamily phosphohydrolase/phosphomutase